MENKLFAFMSKYMVLTPAEKQAILELDLFRQFEKGTVLLKEGEYSDESYLVLEGCLRTYYLIDGQEKTTAFYTDSETFSPICVNTKAASPYYVACVDDCLLAVSNPSMEQKVWSQFPRFETLCRLVTENLLAQQQASFASFKTSSPEERYLELVATKPLLLQRVPQHQLASYLGITPESLSRIRSRLLKQAKS